MNQKDIKKLLKIEKEILLIKKSSDQGIFSYFSSNSVIIDILFLLLRKRKYNYLVITKKRIVFIMKNKLIENLEYNDFQNIKFNTNNDQISFRNIENKNQIISLKRLRLTYKEIQKLKNILN